jgi:hypothetical protein
VEAKALLKTDHDGLFTVDELIAAVPSTLGGAIDTDGGLSQSGTSDSGRLTAQS